MKKIYSFILIAGSLLSSGCATILNDDVQTLNVHTTNNTATTAAVGGYQINTPTAIKVERAKDNLVITTNNNKCQPVTTIESKLSPLFWYNAVLPASGLYGSTTDYATGNMWEYEKTDLFINCNN